MAKETNAFRKKRLRGLALCGLVSLTGLALWMIVSQFIYGGFGQGSRATGHAVTFEEKTGLRLIRVAVTAAGGMIDLRYQVLDPDKALIVHDQTRPPRLIDEATGRTLSRPWMAHAHKREQRMAVTYYQLLMNAGGMLKRGSLVTVVIGDARLEHVVVQ